MRRLPPLNAIRAFEAAGRHLSFTKAADELNVTAAAISQQVRNLEDIVGVPLFRRLTRAIMLTDAGQAALPLFSEGLDRLADGAEKMRVHENTGVLTVSAAPSFAAKWLVRRLPHFQMLYPDIRIRLDPTLGLVDFGRENVDIAIRFGEGRYPGLRTDLLVREQTSPVCSPDLLVGPHPLLIPDNIRYHNLLHCDWGYSDGEQPDWAMWLQLAGIEGIDTTRGLTFTTEALALEAAADGQGVALANSKIVANDIRAGHLVAPFELFLTSAYGFYVVCPEATADDFKNAAFRAWLLEEAGAEDS
ncbi:MAG: transcriptional regulator GcvA [Rhodospirillales bacterium]|nr:transcriptional regulator GcvA [Rhodospirillales bacterium]